MPRYRLDLRLLPGPEYMLSQMRSQLWLMVISPVQPAPTGVSSPPPVVTPSTVQTPFRSGMPMN